MTQTPREAAEAVRQAIEAVISESAEYWAGTMSGLPNGDDVSEWLTQGLIVNIAERLETLPTLSEPTAEGQDELRRQLWNMTQLATERHAERDEARADLARMKAAMEIACRRGCDHCADDIREARAALKETSP